MDARKGVVMGWWVVDGRMGRWWVKDGWVSGLVDLWMDRCVN